MTLQYFDSLFQRDNLQKSQFFKGLPKVLPKLPKVRQTQIILLIYTQLAPSCGCIIEACYHSIADYALAVIWSAIKFFDLTWKLAVEQINIFLDVWNIFG